MWGNGSVEAVIQRKREDRLGQRRFLRPEPGHRTDRHRSLASCDMTALIDPQQRNPTKPEGSCRPLSLALTSLESLLKQLILQSILPLSRWQRGHALEPHTGKRPAR